MMWTSPHRQEACASFPCITWQAQLPCPQGQDPQPWPSPRPCPTSHKAAQTRCCWWQMKRTSFACTTLTPICVSALLLGRCMVVPSTAAESSGQMPSGLSSIPRHVSMHSKCLPAKCSPLVCNSTPTVCTPTPQRAPQKCTPILHFTIVSLHPHNPSMHPYSAFLVCTHYLSSIITYCKALYCAAPLQQHIRTRACMSVPSVSAQVFVGSNKPFTAYSLPTACLQLVCQYSQLCCLTEHPML